MALDLLTWLIISASILAAYGIALKFSDRPRPPQIMEAHQIETPLQFLQNPEPSAPQPPAENAGQPPAGEQEKQPGEAASSISTELGGGVDEGGSQSELISEKEFMELEKEIEDLKTLLEISNELRGEIEKLVKVLKGWKTGKTVN
ncbi:MAG: hypothetical protein N3F65_05120 [Nitrososphaeria archaeon]|nr:hypothetical protein [Aigarchaeota archaeon]MCX8187971.1 hypothetical protein [Nitrososphaeria archaeon]MDW8021746.1 hypothetical protein [Nitrososphaerota archaeon]